MEKLTYEIEYTYTEYWVPPRCRKPRPGDFKDVTTLEITSLTGEEAPVVALWRSHERIFVRNGGTEVVELEIRWHDGMFLINNDVDGMEFRYFKYRTAKTANQLAERVRLEHVGNSCAGCNGPKEKNLKEIHEVSKQAVVIDGEVWRVIPEPLWTRSLGRYFSIGIAESIPWYKMADCFNVNTDPKTLWDDEQQCDLHVDIDDDFEVLVPEVFVRDPRRVMEDKLKTNEEERIKLMGLLLGALGNVHDDYECIELQTEGGSKLNVRLGFNFRDDEVEA